MISASVIKASYWRNHKPIYTLELKYPRFIHPEFLTHRVFSRNSSSNRALNTDQLIAQVRLKPVLPLSFGKNCKGMQAREELDEKTREKAKALWIEAAHCAADFATKLKELGLHKQVVNRILEPFLPIHTIVTSTEWDNFFELRIHPDAQPEMQSLAKKIKKAIETSHPEELDLDFRWHLPYIKQEDLDSLDNIKKNNPTLNQTQILILLSAARCARVSYNRHNQNNYDADYDLAFALRLLKNKHLSPFEHQAMPDLTNQLPTANFVGWVQSRKFFELGITINNEPYFTN